MMDRLDLDRIQWQWLKDSIYWELYKELELSSQLSCAFENSECCNSCGEFESPYHDGGDIDEDGWFSILVSCGCNSDHMECESYFEYVMMENFEILCDV